MLADAEPHILASFLSGVNAEREEMISTSCTQCFVFGTLISALVFGFVFLLLPLPDNKRTKK
jgi:hypothetical protein